MLQRGRRVQHRDFARDFHPSPAGDGCQLEFPSTADASKRRAEIRRLGPRMRGQDDELPSIIEESIDRRPVTCGVVG